MWSSGKKYVRQCGKCAVNTVAIILARGGSKGVPGKNLREVAGLPLIAWSIQQAIRSTEIKSVWLSSDCDQILNTAVSFGAQAILRPDYLANDTATSESAWIHAVKHIENETAETVDVIVGMQPTSPIRGARDLDEAIALFKEKSFDSMLSVTKVQDYFEWKIDEEGQVFSSNYDHTRRKRRQDIEETFLENGSFYIFTKEGLEDSGNRLFGNIGMFQMEKHKMYQVDDLEDLTICDAILRGFDYC